MSARSTDTVTDTDTKTDRKTHDYKYSLLSMDMKTKVVQHVPTINTSISHITGDM